VGIENVVESLELRMNRMISFLPERRRPYFNELEKRFTAKGILLAGPLLHLGRRSYHLHCSLSTAGSVHTRKYDGLIIDEVHYLKDWSLHVKSLHDSFPNKKIWLSDSSSVVLRKGVVDLSRRFVVHNLPLMSLESKDNRESSNKFLKK